jgi:hypothetical protein
MSSFQPTVTANAPGLRENDKHANNEVLTEAVHRIFSVLRSWSAGGDNETSIYEGGPFISFHLEP